MTAPIDRLCLPVILSPSRGILEAPPAAIEHSREERYKPTHDVGLAWAPASVEGHRPAVAL